MQTKREDEKKTPETNFKTPFLMKTVRAESLVNHGVIYHHRNQSWRSVGYSMTKSDKTDQELYKTHRPVRANKPKKAFKRSLKGVTKSDVPFNTVEEKKRFSKKTSTTYVDPSENYYPAPAQFELSALSVGVSIPLTAAIVQLIGYGNLLSYERTHLYESVKDAETEIKNYATDLSDLSKTAENLKVGQGHNEVFARTYFEIEGEDPSKMLVTAHNYESLLLTQIRARDMKRRLIAQYEEMKKPFPFDVSTYEVPLAKYFVEKDAKELNGTYRYTPYKSEDQKKDLAATLKFVEDHPDKSTSLASCLALYLNLDANEYKYVAERYFYHQIVAFINIASSLMWESSVIFYKNFVLENLKFLLKSPELFPRIFSCVPPDERKSLIEDRKEFQTGEMRSAYLLSLMYLDGLEEDRKKLKQLLSDETFIYSETFTQKNVNLYEYAMQHFLFEEAELIRGRHPDLCRKSSLEYYKIAAYSAVKNSNVEVCLEILKREPRVVDDGKFLHLALRRYLNSPELVQAILTTRFPGEESKQMQVRVSNLKNSIYEKKNYYQRLTETIFELRTFEDDAKKWAHLLLKDVPFDTLPATLAGQFCEDLAKITSKPTLSEKLTEIISKTKRDYTEDFKKMLQEEKHSPEEFEAVYATCFEKKNYELLKTLIQYAAIFNLNLDKQVPPLNYTLLMTAIVEGDNTVVSALLDAKVNVDAKDENDSTPLILAAVKNNKEAITLLLGHGADINCVNKEFKSAEALVRSQGSLQILKNPKTWRIIQKLKEDKNSEFKMDLTEEQVYFTIEKVLETNAEISLAFYNQFILANIDKLSYILMKRMDLLKKFVFHAIVSNNTQLLNITLPALKEKFQPLELLHLALKSSSADMTKIVIDIILKSGSSGFKNIDMLMFAEGEDKKRGIDILSKKIEDEKVVAADKFLPWVEFIDVEWLSKMPEAAAKKISFGLWQAANKLTIDTYYSEAKLLSKEEWLQSLLKAKNAKVIFKAILCRCLLNMHLHDNPFFQILSLKDDIGLELNTNFFMVDVNLLVQASRREDSSTYMHQVLLKAGMDPLQIDNNILSVFQSAKKFPKVFADMKFIQEDLLVKNIGYSWVTIARDITLTKPRGSQSSALFFPSKQYDFAYSSSRMTFSVLHPPKKMFPSIFNENNDIEVGIGMGFDIGKDYYKEKLLDKDSKTGVKTEFTTNEMHFALKQNCRIISTFSLLGRLYAKVYANDLRRSLHARYAEVKQTLPDTYQVPISIYSSEGQFCLPYPEKTQKQNLQFALTLKDSETHSAEHRLALFLKLDEVDFKSEITSEIYTPQQIIDFITVASGLTQETCHMFYGNFFLKNIQYILPILERESRTDVLIELFEALSLIVQERMVMSEEVKNCEELSQLYLFLLTSEPLSEKKSQLLNKMVSKNPEIIFEPYQPHPSLLHAMIDKGSSYVKAILEVKVESDDKWTDRLTRLKSQENKNTKESFYTLINKKISYLYNKGNVLEAKNFMTFLDDGFKNKLKILDKNESELLKKNELYISMEECKFSKKSPTEFLKKIHESECESTLKLTMLKSFVSQYDFTLGIEDYNQIGQDLLKEAIESGTADEVELLLKSGVNPNYLVDGMETPLMLAMDNSASSIINKLLESKCDVNFRSATGRTALMKAVEQDEEKLVTKFLEAGANVKLVDEDSASVFTMLDENNKIFKLLTAHIVLEVNKRRELKISEMESKSFSCKGDTLSLTGLIDEEKASNLISFLKLNANIDHINLSEAKISVPHIIELTAFPYIHITLPDNVRKLFRTFVDAHNKTQQKIITKHKAKVAIELVKESEEKAHRLHKEFKINAKIELLRQHICELALNAPLHAKDHLEWMTFNKEPAETILAKISESVVKTYSNLTNIKNMKKLNAAESNLLQYLENAMAIIDGQAPAPSVGLRRK